jgi:hypothetical protein
LGFRTGDRCPPAQLESLPRRAGCVTSATGDLDGDGRPDEVVVYALLDRRHLPRTWHIRGLLSRAGEQSLPLDAKSPSYRTVVGAVDADGDGRDEVFVKLFDHIYHSGASPVVTLFGVEKGRFEAVRTEEGDPLLIDVGGVSSFGRGVECDDVDGDGALELVVLGIENAVSERPRWRKFVYEWTGNRVRLEDVRQGRLEREGFTDPRVLRFYELRCRSLDPPYPY